MLSCRSAKSKTAQVFALGHIKGHPPFLAQPASHAGMVGVVMRRYDGFYRLALQMLDKYLLPQRLSGSQCNTGIDNPPTVIIFKQVQVDVIKGHGQWHTQPQHARGNLLNLARVGNIIK